MAAIMVSGGLRYISGRPAELWLPCCLYVSLERGISLKCPVLRSETCVGKACASQHGGTWEKLDWKAILYREMGPMNRIMRPSDGVGVRVDG